MKNISTNLTKTTGTNTFEGGKLVDIKIVNVGNNNTQNNGIEIPRFNVQQNEVMPQVRACVEPAKSKRENERVSFVNQMCSMARVGINRFYVVLFSILAMMETFALHDCFDGRYSWSDYMNEVKALAMLFIVSYASLHVLLIMLQMIVNVILKKWSK